MDVAVIASCVCSFLAFFVGDSAMLADMSYTLLEAGAAVQGLCSSTAGVGVHAAGSERKQWLREDPCGAAQLDNRSVRGGPAVFARLLAC